MENITLVSYRLFPIHPSIGRWAHPDSIWLLKCVCTCAATQPCLTLCNSMICSPPGSSVRGIILAIILECVAVSFSRGSSWAGDWTWVSSGFHNGRWILTTEPPGKQPHRCDGQFTHTGLPYMFVVPNCLTHTASSETWFYQAKFLDLYLFQTLSILLFGWNCEC